MLRWGPEFGVHIALLTDLIVRLKIEHEFEDYILKLRRIFYWVGIAEIWQESDATLAQLCFHHTMDRTLL